MSICQLLSKRSSWKYSQTFLNCYFLYNCTTYLIKFSSLFLFTFAQFYLRKIPYGLAVRIPGSHPGGPGSTPGMGTQFLSVHTLPVLLLVFI